MICTARTLRSYNIPKFYEHFVREDINANTGEGYNTIPLLTGEEALSEQGRSIPEIK